MLYKVFCRELKPAFNGSWGCLGREWTCFSLCACFFEYLSRFPFCVGDGNGGTLSVEQDLSMANPALHQNIWFFKDIWSISSRAAEDTLHSLQTGCAQPGLAAHLGMLLQWYCPTYRVPSGKLLGRRDIWQQMQCNPWEPRPLLIGFL